MRKESEGIIATVIVGIALAIVGAVLPGRQATRRQIIAALQYD